MFLVYRPEGEPEQRFEFKPGRMRAAEAEGLEKRTGWDYAEYGQHLIQGSVLARRALLWMFLRRVHHVLRFEDVDFAVGELELEYDQDELTQVRDKMAEQGADAAMLAELDKQIEIAPESPGKANASSAG